MKMSPQSALRWALSSRLSTLWGESIVSYGEEDDSDIFRYKLNICEPTYHLPGHGRTDSA